MKAITLVELLVSMFILVIVVALSGPVFVNAYNLYQRASSSYKMQTDYVSLLWNLKIRIAGAKEISYVSQYPTMSERIDIQELNPAVLTAGYYPVGDYASNTNFITRSFYLFKANPNDWQTWEMRFYPNGYPSDPFTTLVKGAISDLDIFRPDDPGPETNNYNDCFLGMNMRSKIKPGAPAASDIRYRTIMRLTARCRRAGR